MRLAWLLVLAGCSASSLDIVGPFTGKPYRFVVDRFTWPITSSSISPAGDDLDGDGRIDNRTSELISGLDMVHDITSHAGDMIASGELASEVELVADSLSSDDSVGLFYHGVAGDQPIPVGGRLSTLGFASNRTRSTHVPGEAVIRMPIFADADPMAVHVVGLEVQLTTDGLGGFDGLVAGGMLPEDLSEPEFLAITQMITANPQDHLAVVDVSDTDHDGVLSRDEVARSPLSLTQHADLRLFDHGQYDPSHDPANADAISFGFTIHITPCPTGRCSTTAPADSCHDRVLDGNETDVDCGGSCHQCPAAAICRVPGDCQTAACDAGHCRTPTCSDGLRDGFETDLDCGGNCAGCLLDQRCVTDHDCVVGHCTLGGLCQ